MEGTCRLACGCGIEGLLASAGYQSPEEADARAEVPVEGHPLALPEHRH